MLISSMPVEIGEDVPSSSDPIPAREESSDLLRRTTRVNARKPLVKFGSWETDIASYISYASIPPEYKSFLASLDSVHVPNNWQVAKQDPRWLSVMQEEL
jgi:hypothetical protein